MIEGTQFDSMIEGTRVYSGVPSIIESNRVPSINILCHMQVIGRMKVTIKRCRTGQLTAQDTSDDARPVSTRVVSQVRFRHIILPLSATDTAIRPVAAVRTA